MPLLRVEVRGVPWAGRRGLDQLSPGPPPGPEHKPLAAVCPPVTPGEARAPEERAF